MLLDQLTAVMVGVIIGFGMAVPVGPVGLIVFQRSIVKSRLMGFITGVGATVADGFMASIGAFGIKMILHFIVREEDILHLIGGVMLLCVGLYGIFSKYKPAPLKKDSAITYIEHFISGIVLCITNPLSALSFLFIFTQIGPRLGLRENGVAVSLVTGVVLGSLLWWILLTTLASFIGHKIKARHIEIMNKCFGVIITFIGLVFLIGAIF